jgi:hypothetical protein
MLQKLSDLHPAAGTAAYLFGERHLVRTAELLLVAGGLDRDAIASKAQWPWYQPNASHGEPSFDSTWAPVALQNGRRDQARPLAVNAGDCSEYWWVSGTLSRGRGRDHEGT